MSVFRSFEVLLGKKYKCVTKLSLKHQGQYHKQYVCKNNVKPPRSAVLCLNQRGSGRKTPVTSKFEHAPMGEAGAIGAFYVGGIGNGHPDGGCCDIWACGQSPGHLVIWWLANSVVVMLPEYTNSWCRWMVV